jgi:multicomponent Na+:H+ antiporter subunit B
MVLLTLLAVVTIGILRQRSLFGAVILFGIYSFLMASIMMVLDAVDVAMVEASVGAGVATVIFLATLHLIRTTEVRPTGRNPLPLLVAVTTGAVLTWGVMILPPFGLPDNPIHLHVAPYYVANSLKDTNIANVVSAVLADYRGYDTLGETAVIFTAGIGVVLLLHRAHEVPKEDGRGMHMDLILRVGTKMIVPFILLFALYVQFHGDYGPGGGFPAGVIGAGMVILVAITFGLDTAKLIAPQQMVERLMPLGVLIFAGVGLIGLLMGRNFLDYSVFPGGAAHARELGILFVEIGVLVTVLGTMIAIFYAFDERSRS